MTKAKIALYAAEAVLLAGSLVAGGILIKKRAELKKLEKSTPELPENFTYTAHTGCMGTKANSLDSFEAAVRNGAAVVEFDLNFTADGKAVLSHDDPVGGEISLDEAFRKISGYDDLLVNVDVKNTHDLAQVRPLAEKHGIADRIFYTGIHDGFVEAVKKDSPDVPYYLNVSVEKNTSEAYIRSLVEKVKDSGAVGINFNKKYASKALVDAFHENGLLVSVWTANNKSDICRLLSLSPDNITTKRPDIIKSIFEKK